MKYLHSRLWRDDPPTTLHRVVTLSLEGRIIMWTAAVSPDRRMSRRQRSQALELARHRRACRPPSLPSRPAWPAVPSPSSHSRGQRLTGAQMRPSPIPSSLLPWTPPPIQSRRIVRPPPRRRHARPPPTPTPPPPFAVARCPCPASR
jgi:hypothetical protein